MNGRIVLALFDETWDLHFFQRFSNICEVVVMSLVQNWEAKVWWRGVFVNFSENNWFDFFSQSIWEEFKKQSKSKKNQRGTPLPNQSFLSFFHQTFITSNLNIFEKLHKNLSILNLSLENFEIARAITATKANICLPSKWCKLKKKQTFWAVTWTIRR